MIQSTSLYNKVLLPVPLCITKYYSTTTLYCSALQSITTILHQFSTTLHYKVLLQYYSLKQRTTTYYSSTTLYYTVLLQHYKVLPHYFVLQSTSPVLLCTAKYYNILLQNSSVLLQYYKGLLQNSPILCTTLPTKYYSNTTLVQYYSVHILLQN